LENLITDIWTDNKDLLIHIAVDISIILIALVFAAILRRIFNRLFIKFESQDQSGLTKLNFLKQVISVSIYVGAVAFIIYRIPALKSVALSIFASAGILALIIGFAAQQAFANIISGLFIIISKPFQVNDRIRVAGKLEVSGIVEEISLRHTVIRNFENQRVVVPNSIIGNETIINSNLNDEKICRFVELGISYDSNINLAMQIIEDEASNHPFCIDNRTEIEVKTGVPKVIVRVIGFGDSSVNLRGYAWAANPPDAFAMGCDLNKSIKERFDKEGVELPYPHRTVITKNN